jgi:heme/copper-type cytochrome/quinol oxidase subunit 2
MTKTKSYKMKGRDIIYILIGKVILLLQSVNQTVFAQRPTHIPPESPPVRFFDSPSNIIFFVVVPILVLLVYLIWKARTRSEQKKKEQERREKRQ